MSQQPPTESPIRPDQDPADGLVLVITGDGKGKSSSAFGTILRAVARGWSVAVIQFLKSEDWRVGEEDVCRGIGVDWWTLGDGFSWDSEDLDKSQAVAQEAWRFARETIEAGQHKVVVLDEVTYPMNWGWIDSADVIATIAGRPEGVYVIATGRDAPDELIDVGDTVSEVRNVKHAYDKGIQARRGFDY